MGPRSGARRGMQKLAMTPVLFAGAHEDDLVPIKHAETLQAAAPRRARPLPGTPNSPRPVRVPPWVLSLEGGSGRLGFAEHVYTSQTRPPPIRPPRLELAVPPRRGRPNTRVVVPVVRGRWLRALGPTCCPTCPGTQCVFARYGRESGPAFVPNPLLQTRVSKKGRRRSSPPGPRRRRLPQHCARGPASQGWFGSLLRRR